MLKNKVSIFLSILFCLSCKSNKEEQQNSTYTDVVSIAAMKDVMWKGELFSKIKLDTINPKSGLYGLGPKAYLRGEIVINNGKTYVSRVLTDSTMTVKEMADAEAPFFAYANVNDWNTIELPLKIKTIKDVGLGYITLGQQSTTLSGGEAQRIKLATELSKRDTGNTFYILDEPTTGLHFEDIRVLMIVLNKLVDKGNTVLIIEHNLDVIKTVDYIIDIGPEGGKQGGKIMALGTPEEIAEDKKSYTARFLKKELHS